MESTSSIFPPYAMVLGKDALEIFGKTLSDFEFITADGDSIGVPVYLLRKRWGDILIHYYQTAMQIHLSIMSSMETLLIS